MRADTLRWILIAALAVAAVVSVIANKSHSAAIGWVGFAVFAVAVLLFFRWRRAALAERREGRRR
jgi:cytochrome oxidase assembly protein ShyY1